MLLLLLACAFQPTEGTWSMTVQTTTTWGCTDETSYYQSGDSWQMGVYPEDDTVLLDLGHEDGPEQNCEYAEPEIECKEVRVDDYSETFDVIITWADTLTATFVNEDRLEGTLFTEMTCEGLDCDTRGTQFAPGPDAAWPCNGETSVFARPE
jgi:hypothetical protein